MSVRSGVEPGKHLNGTWSLFPGRAGCPEAGYAMAGLLVTIAVMSVLISVILPVWSQAAQREREAELIFRGEQYARAIELYQRQYVGAYPPDIRTLIDQRFLRKEYEDPMTDDGEFRIVYFSQVDELQEQTDPEAESEEGEEDVSEVAGRRLQIDQIRFDDDQEGGVVGVVSRSNEESIRVYNGADRYSEWAFVYVTSATEAGAVQGSSGLQPAGLGGDRRPGRPD